MPVAVTNPRAVLGLRGHQSDRLSESRAAARAVVGRRFGLVPTGRSLPQRAALPRLAVYAAEGSARLAWADFRRFPNRLLGTGVSTEPELARLAAIAEVVERYTAFTSRPGKAERVHASFVNLVEAAVAPSEFALLSSRQYRRLAPLQPLTDSREIDWCRAYSLTHGRAALLPEAFIYPGRVGQSPNNFVAELNSTGVACDVSVPHGVLSALCEVLERDALAVAWHGRLPLVELDPAGSPAEGLIAGPLAAAGHTFSLYQVPSEHPFPVILAVAWNRDEQPHAVTGAACRPDPVDAATKSLLEASQMLWRMHGRRLSPPEAVRSFDDHAVFFATSRGSQLLRRQLSSVVERRRLTSMRTPGSAASELDRAVANLAEFGLEVLTAELTTPDVAGTGYRVFRVVVPGTIELPANPRNLRLGGHRLYEVPMRLGDRQRQLRENQLNLLPGPLG